MEEILIAVNDLTRFVFQLRFCIRHMIICIARKFSKLIHFVDLSNLFSGVNIQDNVSINIFCHIMFWIVESYSIHEHSTCRKIEKSERVSFEWEYNWNFFFKSHHVNNVSFVTNTLLKLLGFYCFLLMNCIHLILYKNISSLNYKLIYRRIIYKIQYINKIWILTKKFWNVIPSDIRWWMIHGVHLVNYKWWIWNAEWRSAVYMFQINLSCKPRSVKIFSYT